MCQLPALSFRMAIGTLAHFLDFSFKRKLYLCTPKKKINYFYLQDDG